MIIAKLLTKFSQLDSSIRNISTTYIPSKELGHTREKMSNTQQPDIVGYILTIGQSISMVPAPWKPQIAQQTTTQLESKKYWKEWKRLFPQLFRNSKRSANQLAQPYKHVETPQHKQVCFLLHPYPKENNQPQYHPEPELLLPIPQHQKPAHPRDPYRLHHHSQQHHNHLQAIHHLTHQHLQQWLNRTNPEFWEQPQNYMMVPARRPLPFGIPLPIITPSTMAFIPPMPRRSHQPLPTLK